MDNSLQRTEILEAVQKAALSVGAKTLAIEMDLALSSVYSIISPSPESAKLSLENAFYIMRRSGDVTALEMMAHELGYTLQKIEPSEPEKKTVDAECCEDFAALAEFSRLARCVDVFPLPKPLDIINLAAKAKDEIDQTAHLWLRKWEDRQ